MANYCTQCVDTVSGVAGDFLYCPVAWAERREFVAISPVFAGLVEFFKWARDNSVTLIHN